MKKLILPCLFVAVVALGGTYAYAYCNPWVQKCGPFNQDDAKPLSGGDVAAAQGCGWLGCGW